MVKCNEGGFLGFKRDTTIVNNIDGDLVGNRQILQTLKGNHVFLAKIPNVFFGFSLYVICLPSIDFAFWRKFAYKNNVEPDGCQTFFYS
jgi:hypothetical protein